MKINTKNSSKSWKRTSLKSLNKLCPLIPITQLKGPSEFKGKLSNLLPKLKKLNKQHQCPLKI